MNLQQSIRYAKWHATTDFTEFQWGKNDEFLTFCSMQDYVYGLNTLKNYKNKWHDINGYSRWYRTWDLSLNQWMTLNGWTKQDDSLTGNEGEIRIVHYQVPRIFMKHDGLWWRMDEERKGMVGYKTSAFGGVDYTHWIRRA